MDKKEINWNDIKRDYEEHGLGYRDIADKYDNVFSYIMVQRRAKKEGWIKGIRFTRSRKIRRATITQVENLAIVEERESRLTLFSRDTESNRILQTLKSHDLVGDVAFLILDETKRIVEGLVKKHQNNEITSEYFLHMCKLINLNGYQVAEIATSRYREHNTSTNSNTPQQVDLIVNIAKAESGTAQYN